MSLENMQWSVSYESSPPPEYRCETCGASGVKLWREYNTFLSHQSLECCGCAGKSQGKDVSKIDADGRTPFSIGKYADGTEAIQWSDSIGWRIPAVPTEEGDTFWGYSSVPERGVQWWRRLPTHPITEESKP